MPCPLPRLQEKLPAWIDKGVGRGGSNRVNRGGNWNNNAQNCRVSNRNNNNPDNRNNNIGFRLVLRSLWHEVDSRL